MGLNVSYENKNGAQYLTKWSYYGSLHTGDIVQFCFVDDSVHSRSKDVDLTVFQSMSTIRGEEIIPEDTL